VTFAGIPSRSCLTGMARCTCTRVGQVHPQPHPRGRLLAHLPLPRQRDDRQGVLQDILPRALPH
jgi:hypothetical protein